MRTWSALTAPPPTPSSKQAADKYHIPWIRHDFPLPFHAWSFQAAVYARWFDTKSKTIGDDYRDYIFANQPSIETPAQLTQWTEKFAQAHGIALPFAVDPQGKLAAEVKADYALGQRIGIEHTPTIWVVTDGNNAAPFIEIVDRSKLYQIIDAGPGRHRGSRQGQSAPKQSEPSQVPQPISEVPHLRRDSAPKVGYR